MDKWNGVRISVVQEANDLVFYQTRSPTRGPEEGIARLAVQGDEFILLSLQDGTELALDFNDFLQAFIQARCDVIKIRRRLGLDG